MSAEELASDSGGVRGKRFRRVLVWCAVPLVLVGVGIGVAYFGFFRAFEPSGANKARMKVLRREPVLAGAPGWQRIRLSETSGTGFAGGTTKPSIIASWTTGRKYTKANFRYIAQVLPKLYSSDYGDPTYFPDGFAMVSKTSGVIANGTLHAFVGRNISIDVTVS